MNNYDEISQLVQWERQSRVRYLADDLANCFFPDATVTTSWTSGPAQAYLSGGQKRKPSSRYPILNRLGPAVIHQNGNRAVVELPSTTTRWIMVNGEEAVMDSYMRLIYRVECRDGVWKIVDMTGINECDTLQPAIPGTDLHINPKDLEGLRVSYRYLAYLRILEGREVSDDLLGTDRPEEIDKIYADAFAWRDARP